MTYFNPEPILPSEDERSDLAKLEEILNRLNNGQQGQTLQTIDPETGEAIELPNSILNLLRQSLHHFNQGKGVILENFHQPLTTNEAAYFLNFPREHLLELLQNGEIPSTGEGVDRRIEFEDLMAYKKTWEEVRHEAIVEITQMLK